MGHDAFRAGVESAGPRGDGGRALARRRVPQPDHVQALRGQGGGVDTARRRASTFEDFRYTDELDGDGVKALVFEARVGDKQVQGLDLLRFDDQGLIEDFTVMVRPLSAAMALAEAVGKGLERAAAAAS